MIHIRKLTKIFQLDLINFIYYNFICSSVIRDKDCYIYPFKHSIIDIRKSSRIYLHSNLMFNTNKLKYSKAECYLRMSENSELHINGNVNIFYNVTIEVKNNSILEIGNMSANSGTVIVCSKKIIIGDGVTIARNVVIYDNDFHDILDTDGNIINKSKEVIIGNDVWIGINTVILKGVVIGDGAVISANSWVIKSVDAKSLVSSFPSQKISNNIIWRK